MASQIRNFFNNIFTKSEFSLKKLKLNFKLLKEKLTKIYRIRLTNSPEAVPTISGADHIGI